MESLNGTPLGRYGYGSVLFWIVFTFVFGLLFACFSYGFLWFIVFWILYAILYSLAVDFKYPIWRLFTIMGLFFAGLTGFLLGRYLIGDPDPFKSFYSD